MIEARIPYPSEALGPPLEWAWDHAGNSVVLPLLCWGLLIVVLAWIYFRFFGKAQITGGGISINPVQVQRDYMEECVRAQVEERLGREREKMRREMATAMTMVSSPAPLPGIPQSKSSPGRPAARPGE
jgi:hypothetical protein